LVKDTTKLILCADAAVSRIEFQELVGEELEQIEIGGSAD
jgi:hypothetical protein